MADDWLRATWQFSPPQLAIEAVFTAIVWISWNSGSSDTHIAFKTSQEVLPRRESATFLSNVAGVIGPWILAVGLVLAAIAEGQFGSLWFILTPCSVLSWMCAIRYAVGSRPLASLDRALGSTACLLALVSSFYVLDCVAGLYASCQCGWGVGTCTAGDSLNVAAEVLLHLGLFLCSLDLLTLQLVDPNDSSLAAWEGMICSWEALCFWHATGLVLISVFTGLNVGFVTHLPEWGVGALTGFAALTKIHCATFLGGGMLLCDVATRPLIHGFAARIPTAVELGMAAAAAGSMMAALHVLS